MIELAIKIPEDVYTRLFDNGIQDNEIAVDDVCEMARALRLGTPLPEHHGRLIDEEDIALIDEQFYVPSDYYVAESAINDAPTIIEADKECDSE